MNVNEKNKNNIIKYFGDDYYFMDNYFHFLDNPFLLFESFYGTFL